MKFPVDILATASQGELERSAQNYMTNLLYSNPDYPECLTIANSIQVSISISSVGFVPLYGTSEKHKILALFAPNDSFTAVGLYLLGQWWTVEDILRTADSSRAGAVEVQTVGERIVLYLLNRVIYRAKEMSTVELPFLCHGENDFAKLFWKNGEAVGFYSVKPTGSLFGSFLTRSYQLPVMDSIFVRKLHRGKGYGLQMLEDFVLSYKEDCLGLRYPLPKSMFKLCQKYLWQYPGDTVLLWEVENIGRPNKRTNIASKIQAMDLSVSKNLSFTEDSLMITEKEMGAQTQEQQSMENTVEIVEEVTVLKATKASEEVLVATQNRRCGSKHTEDSKSEKVIRIEDIEAETPKEVQVEEQVTQDSAEIAKDMQAEAVVSVTTEAKAVDEIDNAPEVAATAAENLSTILVSLTSQHNIDEAAHSTSTQVEDASAQDLNAINSCGTKISIENVASETEEEQSENERTVVLIVSEKIVEVCKGAGVLDNMEEETKDDISEETAAQHESSHLSEYQGMLEHGQMGEGEVTEKTEEQAPVEDLIGLKEGVRTQAEEAAKEVQLSTEMEVENHEVQEKEQNEGAAPELGTDVGAANVTSVEYNMIQENDSVLVTAASVTVTHKDVQEVTESSTVLADVEEVHDFSSMLHKATVVLVDLKSTCHPVQVKETEQTVGNVEKETSHFVVEQHNAESEMLKEEERSEGENIKGKLFTVYSEKAIEDEVKSTSTTTVAETRTTQEGGVYGTITEQEEDTETAADEMILEETNSEEPQRVQRAPQISDLQRVTVVLVDMRKNVQKIQEETTTVDMGVLIEEIPTETEDQQKELMEDEMMVKENAPSFPVGKLDEEVMVLVKAGTLHNAAEGKQSTNSDTCENKEMEAQGEKNAIETCMTTEDDEGKSVDKEKETTITERRYSRRGKRTVTATPRCRFKRSKQNDEEEEEPAGNGDEDEAEMNTRVLRRGRKSVTVIQKRKLARSGKQLREDQEEPTTKLDEEDHSKYKEEPVTEHRTLRTGRKAVKAIPACKSTTVKRQEEEDVEEEVSITDVSEPSVQTNVSRKRRNSGPVAPKYEEVQPRQEVKHLSHGVVEAEKEVTGLALEEGEGIQQITEVNAAPEEVGSVDVQEKVGEQCAILVTLAEVEPLAVENSNQTLLTAKSDEAKGVDEEEEATVTQENTEEKSAFVAEEEKIEDTLTKVDTAGTVNEEEEDRMGVVKDIEEPVLEETSPAEVQEKNDTAKEEETLIIERSTTINMTEVESDSAVSEEEEMVVEKQSVLETLITEQLEAPVAESSSEHLLTAYTEEANDIEEAKAQVIQTRTLKHGGKAATTTPRRKSKRNQQQNEMDEEADLECVEKNTEFEHAVETRVMRKERRSAPASARQRSKRVRKQLNALEKEDSTLAEGTEVEDGLGLPEEKTGNQEACPDSAEDEADKMEDAFTMEKAVMTVQEWEEVVKEVGSEIKERVVEKLSSAEDEASDTEEETVVIETSTTITTTEVGPATVVSEGVVNDTCVVKQKEVPFLTTEMQQQEEERAEAEETQAYLIHLNDDSGEQSDINPLNTEQTKSMDTSGKNEAGSPAADAVENSVKQTADLIDDNVVESTISEPEREETMMDSPNKCISETKEGQSVEPPLIDGRTLRGRTRGVSDTACTKSKDKEEERLCLTRRSQRIKPVVNYSDNYQEVADEMEPGINDKEGENMVELEEAEDKKNESSDDVQKEIPGQNEKGIEEKAEDTEEAIETTGEEEGVQSLGLGTGGEAELMIITQDAQEEDQTMSKEEEMPVVITERVLRGRSIPSVIITPRSSTQRKKGEEVLETWSLNSEKSPDSVQKRDLRKRKSTELTPVCKAKHHIRK
ncbi:uncharacterized protein LOC143012136 isoform X2 [Genypterus blacodes]|uniref:uncharacterized protein LOC143012136 isoform X2 n=1 Tax=Genypterus blacodes TaxID=154954 RepID=UPI003F759315